MLQPLRQLTRPVNGRLSSSQTPVLVVPRVALRRPVQSSLLRDLEHLFKCLARLQRYGQILLQRCLLHQRLHPRMLQDLNSLWHLCPRSARLHRPRAWLLKMFLQHRKAMGLGHPHQQRKLSDLRQKHPVRRKREILEADLPSTRDKMVATRLPLKTRPMETSLLKRKGQRLLRPTGPRGLR